MTDLINHPLVRSLLWGDMPSDEVLRTYGICVRLGDLSGEVNGFLYVSRRGKRYIVVENSLSPSVQQDTLLHELKHVLKDLPKRPYVFGMDQQGRQEEREADWLAAECRAVYGVGLDEK